MKTFGGIDEHYGDLSSAAVLLQSVPYDGTSTWGKGADKGFEAFIEASVNLELYDIETGSEVYRRGIHIPSPISGYDTPEKMYTAVKKRAEEMLKMDKFCTFFGGEHSISIGIIEAFRHRYQDLTVVQLDAHADLRPEYDGTPYNHACAMHLASLSTNLIQVGIRSMDESERKWMNPEKTYFGSALHKDDHWMEKSVSQMTDNIYISLDLDVLDPSIMPATGTPEPGGMGWYEILSYLRMIFRCRNVVGFDIVELAPIPGLHHPQFTVAKLYYKMLSYKYYAT